MDLLSLNLGLMVFLLACSPLAAQSGLKMRVTQAGLDYLNAFAQAAIRNEVQELDLPNFPFSANRVTGSVSNIRPTGADGPTSHLALSESQNGLAWTLSDFSISVNADWRVRYKRGWFKVNLSGHLELSATDVSLTVTVGFDNNNGRPTLVMRDCTSHIGHVSVRFHGGLAFVYNLFRGYVGRKIKEELTPELCTLASHAVTRDGNAALAKMKVTTELDQNFHIDYSLLAPIAVTSEYLESLNKGEVRWNSDTSPLLVSPPTLPAFEDTSKMLYLWLTEYSVDTFAQSAHRNNALRYTMTRDDLPPEQSQFLETTCEELCIGTIIPGLDILHPDSWVSVGLSSAAPPRMRITPQAINATFKVDVDLVANKPDGTTAHLLRLNTTFSVLCNLSINNDMLSGSIVDHRFNVDLGYSFMGDVEGLAESLEQIVDGILRFFVIPELNERGQGGVDLPLSGDIKIKNANFNLYEGFVILSSDVEYQSGFDQLRLSDL